MMGPGCPDPDPSPDLITWSMEQKAGKSSCYVQSAYLPTLPHSVEPFCIWLMYSAFRIHLKILQNHKFYRICLDSQQMDVKSLIQGTLSWSTDDLWAVTVYTNANGACQSGTERMRLRQEMDRWIERGRRGASGSCCSWLSTKGAFNTNTFTDGFCPIYSSFSIITKYLLRNSSS